MNRANKDDDHAEGPSGVESEGTAEAEAIADRLRADRPWLARRGIELTQWGRDHASGKVKDYLSHYDDAARQVLPAGDDERERRQERDQRREQAAADSRGGVADDSDSQDHRTRCDLAQGHRIEELRPRHPVVGDDRVVLHQRDDHEAAPEGQGAYLDRYPGQRADAASGDRWPGDRRASQVTPGQSRARQSRPDESRSAVRQPGEKRQRAERSPG